MRMATLAPGGRITIDVVNEEIERLTRHVAPGTGRRWRGDSRGFDADRLDEIDLFDRVQLAAVVRVCRGAPSLSEAGRRLFAASRSRKAAPNDADRLRKYLARFGLSWTAVSGER